MTTDAYAKAGVDPRKIGVFKDLMHEVASSTALLPHSRGVTVHRGLAHGHGGVYRVGNGPWMCTTLEGPGNLPWLTSIMYQIDEEDERVPLGYNVVAGVTSVMMAANDCVAQGARPAICLDLVAANNSEWFASGRPAADMAEGIRFGCEQCSMALVAGESPAMKYIINAKEPAIDAPDVCVAVTGVVKNEDELITGERLGPGSCIIGVESDGVHGNGWTLIIDLIREMLKGNATKRLPNGKRLCDELLVSTRCYVPLVEAILDGDIQPHAILPGTGDGVAKLASDKRDLTYHIERWVDIPYIFKYLCETLKIPMKDMLTTFNMGIGYYLFVAPKDIDTVLYLARQLGYQAHYLGVVAAGRRGVDFQGQWLNPKS